MIQVRLCCLCLLDDQPEAEEVVRKTNNDRTDVPGPSRGEGRGTTSRQHGGLIRLGQKIKVRTQSHPTVLPRRRREVESFSWQTPPLRLDSSFGTGRRTPEGPYRRRTSDVFGHHPVSQGQTGTQLTGVRLRWSPVSPQTSAVTHTDPVCPCLCGGRETQH